MLELMIVLAIISITSAMAYPGYTHLQTRLHRKEAQTALLDLAIRMERYYLKHHTYATATIGEGLPSDVLHSALSASHWYHLSISQATKATYVLQAKPLGQQALLDPQCPSLLIDNLGKKTSREGSSSPSKNPCW